MRAGTEAPPLQIFYNKRLRMGCRTGFEKNNKARCRRRVSAYRTDEFISSSEYLINGEATCLQVAFHKLAALFGRYKCAARCPCDMHSIVHKLGQLVVLNISSAVKIFFKTENTLESRAGRRLNENTFALVKVAEEIVKSVIVNGENTRKQLFHKLAHKL